MSDTTTVQMGAPAEKQERPEWLPEKFKSPEELAKAYAEAEKKLSAPVGDGLPKMENADPKAVEQSGVDLDKLAEEVLTTGDLSEESVKALEAKGVSKAQIATYVEGRKAVVKNTRDALAAVAGGDESLDAMVKWGAANYSQEDLSAYNAAVASGNPALAKLAVEGLKARFEAANGAPGQRVTGGSSGAPTGITPFESAFQMAEAMRDPRYQKDPAYRESVVARVRISPQFFAR